MQMKKRNRKVGGYASKAEGEWYAFYLRNYGKEKADAYFTRCLDARLAAKGAQ